jgi:hypothetical protein
MTERIGQFTDEVRLRGSHMLPVNVPPIALVEREGFLGRNRARRIAIPHEHRELGKLGRHDLLMGGHDLHEPIGSLAAGLCPRQLGREFPETAWYSGAIGWN